MSETKVAFDWDALARHPGREWEDGSIVHAALELWRDHARAESAAIYRAGVEGGWRRQVVSGAAEYPERLAELPARGARRLTADLALVLARGVEEAATTLGDGVGQLLVAAHYLHQLNEQLRERRFRDGLRSVQLETLYDVGLQIASTLDLPLLSEEIMMRAVALLDARRGALYLARSGQLELARAVGEALPQLEPADVNEGASGELELAERVLSGARFRLAVPIASDSQSRGLLVVADKESRRGVGPFSAADRRTLLLFASQAAIALENARLHQQALEKERLVRELELAAEIQRSILPSLLPEVPGFSLAGMNRPTRQVGGDYYGVHTGVGRRPCLVVADVTGKGMPAALLVSTLHSALRLLSDRFEPCPELMARLNQHIAESSSANKFITLVLVDIEDAARGVLGYLNAGHNPGLVVRTGGEVEQLLPSGLPLGMLPAATYRQHHVQLAPGDLLCLYSDGITECESMSDEQYGLERLAELLREHRTLPTDELLSVVDRSVQEFGAGRPQGDDQTVLLLRRTAS